MKRAYYTRKHWVIIGLLMPPVIILVNYCLFGKVYFSGAAVFWWSTLLTAGFGMISWYLQLLIALLMNARYPGNNQTLRRVVSSMVLQVLVTMVTVALVFVLYDRLRFFNYQLDPWRMVVACIISSGFAVLATSFHEAVAF